MEPLEGVALLEEPHDQGQAFQAHNLAQVSFSLLLWDT